MSRHAHHPQEGPPAGRARATAVPGPIPAERPGDWHLDEHGTRRVSVVRAAHERFVVSGDDPGRQVRPVVADSWRRSRRVGVDPELPTPPVDVAGSDLAELRSTHPLSGAVPTVRRLLVEPGPDWVAALSDESGRLLWVDGDRAVRRELDGVGFVEGAAWREDAVGTNALGTALATRRPLQVLGTEHWARVVHPWSCAAVPVHDPEGRLLGVLDVTGRDDAASWMALALVRATVAAVEATLTAGAGAPPGARLAVLGTQGGTLHTPAGRRRLTCRHAEILLLLAEHPAGLRGDELAVLLSESELSEVTVRAEISRLRRLVGPLLSESRPYRLTAPLRTDVDAVRDALAIGDVAGALSAYAGSVLPRSTAPGVERVRATVQDEVRAATLASGDPGLVARWTASDPGADDWEAWQTLARVAPIGSAAHLRAHTRLAQLNRTLR
ncbi:GAF domain-containing protein [Cellulomonas sp. zg-ZUI222]|uniref:GAF domain-containing protein n=1 Tax=Cellulomonas wangleii TaxID=2816956 RepID=A0ABX8D4Z6_9CELL|nr:MULTISPECIES: GAF domain-containing protein [Cellulomonas]MBO0898450.1 GAF domain-containing protein [Cellulomonas sp. zg-ZUI22]MBO0919314.1 GAF domain-containing protein [Cellulomonas wangleii]MBO0924540.1 GAF domain-containing protein [Cellulomonas wangleii]QVI62526.1 GAF domain-containing protein [Cellulomonas wangleii]